MPRPTSSSLVTSDDLRGGPAPWAMREHLSAREIAVTGRAIAGQPLKAIAYELKISSNTAATYLTRARRKLGLTSRWKLAALLSGPLPRSGDLASLGPFAALTPSELALGEML